ncbi:ABC transporter ATP-binding protein/permease [uncultured Clostridium sp.]|uniref:ABC transporter ATP-binding protein/permease n=1 Tax=uncultured Clostridium sp. TaxID=59620 RepID=UPI0026DBCF79|nr:ABC transporter ATP-binding protein/permease [uncultured Clostridium sp.]
MMINKRLINLCKESKKYIALTILVNWISVLCNIVTIILIGQFINKIYVGQRLNINGNNILNAMMEFNVWGKISLLAAIVIIAILLSIRYSCNILYAKFSNAASANARVTLRELIYKKLLKLGTGYTSVESTSAVVQVSVEGIEQLEIYFGKYLSQFFYALLVPVTLFIFMSFISFKAALIFILCVPLIPISIIAIMKIAKRILKDYWKSYSDLGGTFLENLQGLTTLKVFNIDEERHEKMNIEAEKFRKITMKVLSMQLNSITIMDLVAFGGAAAGTIVALIQFKNGQIPVGSLLIIILLSSEFFIPLRLLGSYFHIAMNGMAASDRMFGILDAEEREKNVETNEEIKLNDIKVSLRNVDFSYDGEREVLKNINMDVTPGGLVAIVGESGSGKSTIASLILNNYKVTNGEISINNVNIENISLDNIYGNIALVSTNSYIFNGTILDNLLMAKKDATEEDINNALKTARLYDFVNGLKDGLLTDVGQAGSALSGGQKQRLALARVILADRPMIIFDEATSNIDVESEESIWEAIYELSKEKTILVISHRLANVTDAKNIYVMNKGKLVENGTHEELMKNESCYYNMVNKQNELEMIREVC